MSLLLQRPAVRRTLVLLAAFAAAVTLWFTNGAPAKANVLACGSPQNAVITSNYHGQFYVDVGCYPGWILMAYGDSVIHNSGDGGSMRIDPRVECQYHYWGGGYWYRSNTSYTTEMYVNMTAQTTTYVDSCWGI